MKKSIVTQASLISLDAMVYCFWGAEHLDF